MILTRLGEVDLLLASFDAATVARALRLPNADIGEVRLEAMTPDHLRARGAVHGSASFPYQVTIVADEVDGHLEIESWCSCPVTRQCKHAAALALRLGDSFQPGAGSRSGTPAWQGRWDQVLAGLATLAPPEVEPPALAVRFSYEEPHPSGRYRSTSEPTVRLRPMRQGTRGWVKSGIDWHAVPGAAPGGTHDRRQLEALSALHHAIGSHSWYQGVDRTLGDFGSSVVRLLREAADAGVVLYAAAPLTGFRIAEPATLTADARRDPDGVRVELRLSFDGARRQLSDVLLFGTPSHTVAMVEDGTLVLAAIDPPLPSQAITAIRRGPLTVPTTDEAPGDVATRLGRLRRLVPLTSDDGSVELPEPVRPRLRVTVTWATAEAADVRWTWGYGDTEVPVGSRDVAGGLRDPAAERRVLADLPDLDPRDRRVTGADTVGLALLEIPSWRETDALEVVEIDRPEFRMAQVPPAVRFDLVATDGADEADDAPTDWLDLDVVVTVDGERVPLPDVLAALTLGWEFLVLPSGVYIPTDAPEFAGLADAVRAAADLRERDQRSNRMRVGRDDLGMWAELASLGIVDAQAAEWVARAQALRDLVEIPRPEPVGVVSSLRPYQRDGFHWLAFLWHHRLGGVLADDMGLGKTLQVLSLIAHTRAEGDSAPFLVVAPTSVVSAWVSEAAKHTPELRAAAVTSTQARRGASIADLAAEADVVVTTYTLLRLEQEQYAGVAWGGLICDEAQQVKNHQSKAYAAVRRIEAPFRLAVTGTPFENRLMELWSLLSIAAPGLYPSPQRFAHTVVRPVEKEHDDGALRRLRTRIRPFMLRRTKEAVARDLPPKQEQVLVVDLDTKHRRLYDTHLRKEQQRILGLLESFEENRVAVLAALTTLRQLSLDPALIDPDHDAVGSAKLDLLVEHLTEVAAEGHRALVFSTFTAFLQRARSRLEAAGLDSAYLDGTTTRRAEVIEGFRRGDAPVFLISLKAGGVGLTLTEADYVFVLDPWWNPAAEAQAVDRAHRIGQQRTVMVYRLVARDTIEEKVMALKERKAKLFAQVVDGDGTGSGVLTADDLRALFE